MFYYTTLGYDGRHYTPQSAIKSAARWASEHYDPLEAPITRVEGREWRNGTLTKTILVAEVRPCPHLGRDIICITTYE